MQGHREIRAAGLVFPPGHAQLPGRLQRRDLMEMAKCRGLVQGHTQREEVHSLFQAQDPENGLI